MTLYTDIDEYCCAVIRARIADGSLPAGEVWCRDVTTLTDDELAAFDQVHLFCGIGGSPLGFKMAGWPSGRPLITGGFPCQDVSDAGLRAGITAPRSGLFREVVRALRLAPRAYGLLENVAALLRRGMGVVLGELAGIGRDAEWDCLSAAACGFTHLRRRVWITVLPSDACGVRPQRVGPATKQPRTWEQLTRLVQAELRVSVPAGTGGGVADGVSKRMDRLSALGNAQVPQCVEVIARGMIDGMAGGATDG